MTEITAEELQRRLESDDEALVRRTVAEFFELRASAPAASENGKGGGALRPRLALREDAAVLYSAPALKQAEADIGAGRRRGDPSERAGYYERAALLGVSAPWKLLRARLVGLANGWKRRARRRRFQRRMQEEPRPTAIVSEGDSWFQHPLVTDCIDHLSAGGHFDAIAILSLGAAGHDVWQYVRQDEYAGAVEKHRPRVFLISGGGNDFLGEEFYNYLSGYTDGTPGEDARRLVDFDVFDRKLGQVRGYYEQMLGRLRSYDFLQGVVGHTYAYAGQRRGNWLAGPMEERRGITRRKDQKAILRFMVDRFQGRVLEPLRESSGGFFEYADLRGELALREDWHDEIHPSAEGAFHVASKLYAKIRPLLG